VQRDLTVVRGPIHLEEVTDREFLEWFANISSVDVSDDNDRNDDDVEDNDSDDESADDNSGDDQSSDDQNGDDQSCDDQSGNDQSDNMNFGYDESDSDDSYGNADTSNDDDNLNFNGNRAHELSSSTTHKRPRV